MTITDIVNEVYFHTKTSSTDFTAANMLILINKAYERVVSLIMQVDGRWEWDDSNQTDFPIATTDLVNSQQDYSLATTHLAITRIEVKDNNGNWYELKPISESDLKGEALAEFMKTDGLPVYYDKLNSSIFLYPAPATANVTTTAGLKVYFQRPPALYTSAEVTTGTKAPGFNSLYHGIIPLWVSYYFLLSSDQRAAQGYRNEALVLEEALKEDYEMRNKDEKLSLRVKKQSSR